MKVQFDDDEIQSLLSAVAHEVLESAGLSDEDRGRLRRWMSEEMRPGREQFKALQDKANADIARSLKSKERSLIQKHDWV